MFREIPEDIVTQIRVIFDRHDGVWRTARMEMKPIWKEMGWKPTPEEVYVAVYRLRPKDYTAPCGKTKKFDGFWGGYRFCGIPSRCACALEQSQRATIATNMERYGVAAVLSSKEIRTKRKDTMIERYGVEHSAESDFLKDKMKHTNQQRYGHDCVLSSGEIQDKARKTMVGRYGVENASQSSEVVDRRSKTNVARYGSNSPLGNEEIRQMGVETSRMRWGVDHGPQAPEIKEKTRQTVKKRYDVDYLQQSEKMREKSRETLIERYGVATPLASVEILDKVKKTNLVRYGETSASKNPIVKEKSIETNLARYGYEINHWLGNIDVEFRSNVWDVIKINGQRFELDFYFPKHNLAIEFNGLYNHSSVFKDRLYHRRKYEACRDAGIRLLMIDQDDWDARSHVIKSTIMHLLHRSNRGTAARKLLLREISAQQANIFYDDNHIQGRTAFIEYSVGAYEEGTLVASMSFNRQRNTGVIELIRFSTDGKSRAGVFSRLFNMAVRCQRYREIINFADLRYSQGDVYRLNGFKLVAEVPPDYRYVVGRKRLHKTNFTRTKIAKKYPHLSHLSEREAMEALGIPRFYDCGKLKFSWRQDQS